MNERAYIVTFGLVVDDRGDEHLRTAESIKAEIESWLEGLNATAHDVTLQPVTPKKEEQ